MSSQSDIPSGGQKVERGIKNGSRIAKVIAAAGICSRRDAERLIEAGKVTVDGETITTPALTVTPDQKITVNGKPLSATEALRVFLYHKPRGLLTTHRDPEGRPTVFDSLPKTLPRVVSVGRLDLNSEGLLLLTNSGTFARHLELPTTAQERIYRVRLFGTLSQAMLDELAQGVTVDEIRYGPVIAEPQDPASLKALGPDNHWLGVTLREGKNREIRRVFEHGGCKVSRLIRIGYGPFALGDLPRGEVKEIPLATLKALFGKTFPVA